MNSSPLISKPVPPLRRAATWAATLALAGLAGSPAQAQYHVSPQGNDTATGSAIAPVQTLTRALQLARTLRAPGPSGDQTILLREGLHRLDRTIVIGQADNRDEGRTLTVAAFPGERPVLSGGEPIRGWRRLAAADEPAALPAAARGKLWVADLPEVRAGRWRFHALFDGFKLLPRARSAEHTSRTPRVGFANRLDHRDTLDFPEDSIQPWANLGDVEIFSRPNHSWLVNYLGIAAVDTATKSVRTSVPATYCQSGAFWVENTLEVLDEPGEWVLNRAQGRLYLWPCGAEPSSEIVAPRVETLIRVAGRADEQGSADEPVRGIRLRGLTFAHTDRDVWGPADAGIQHDWAMWDNDDACLRFRVAQDCEVTDCTFIAAGNHGIRADLFAQRLRITGNTFRHLGACGVLLCGYGPGTKDVNGHHEVVDNEFQDLGTLWWHSPAIFIWQSGDNLIANNYVHDLPYNGIVVSGVRPRFYAIDTPEVGRPVYPPALRENLRVMRWREIGWPTTAEQVAAFAHARRNVIRDNEIHDVMLRLKDGNAIYVSAAGAGNLVQRNVVYRMGESAAIRTDDDQSGTLITENVMIGSGLVIKDANNAWNNLLINGDLRIASDRPECRIEHNVYYFTQPTAGYCRYDTGNRYYFADKIATGQPVVPPRTDRNLLFAPDEATARKFLTSMQEQWDSDRASVFGHPRLRDPARGDFTFEAGSPALALGIHSIDTSTVGLRREPMRRRLSRGGGIELNATAKPAEVD